MYKIIIYNKWTTTNKWRRVTAKLYQSESQYKRFLEENKNYCRRLCRPLSGGEKTYLSCKLVCQKMIEDKWETIKEFEFGV